MLTNSLLALGCHYKIKFQVFFALMDLDSIAWFDHPGLWKIGLKWPFFVHKWLNNKVTKTILTHTVTYLVSCCFLFFFVVDWVKRRGQGKSKEVVPKLPKMHKVLWVDLAQILYILAKMRSNSCCFSRQRWELIEKQQLLLLASNNENFFLLLFSLKIDPCRRVHEKNGRNLPENRKVRLLNHLCGLLLSKCIT